MTYENMFSINYKKETFLQGYNRIQEQLRKKSKPITIDQKVLDDFNARMRQFRRDFIRKSFASEQEAANVVLTD